MEPYDFRAGTAPLLVSIPHAGTHVPPDVFGRMTDFARALPDTDWYVDRLYAFAGEIGASILKGSYSRYVIDLNRAPDDTPLYPGASNTELCPTTTFSDEPIYKLPHLDGSEVDRRRMEIWRPYHERIKAELSKIRERHGIAILWDAHSIRSQVPRFFDGDLPDLNLGTGYGTTTDPGLVKLLRLVAASAEGYSHVVDGRFKGGYITRNYGRPNEDVHAVQLELNQRTYMGQKPPFGFQPDLAEKLRPVLHRMLQSAIDWAQENAPG